MTRQELSNASAQRSMRLVTESSKLPQCHIDSTLKSKTRKTREREKVYLAWHPCLELRDFLQVFCSPKHSPTMSALAASRATNIAAIPSHHAAGRAACAAIYAAAGADAAPFALSRPSTHSGPGSRVLIPRGPTWRVHTKAPTTHPHFRTPSRQEAPPSQPITSLHNTQHVTAVGGRARSHSPAAKALWVSCGTACCAHPSRFTTHLALDGSAVFALATFSYATRRWVRSFGTYISTRSPQALECSRSFASSFHHSSR